MSADVTVLGPSFEGAGNSVGDDGSQELGSGYRIGDGLILTAGHVAFDYNHNHDGSPSQIGTSSIASTSSAGGVSIALDFNNYRAAYASAVSTSYQASDNAGLPHLLNSRIEAFPSLTTIDSVLVRGSGSVNSSDAGLVLFKNPADLVNLTGSLGSGATISRIGSVTHSVTGAITYASGGTLHFDQDSQLGDSGGAYLLSYDSREFVIGTQSARNAVQQYSLGTYFSETNWTDINSFLALQQHGNVTASEPTNLVVGSYADEQLHGSFRSDIILGGAGADHIDDGDTFVSTVWADDTLVGGSGNDVFVVGKGNDTIWGDEKGNDVTQAGVIDEVDYSSASRPIAIELDGTASTFGISVKDGTGGIDTLHAIEKIKGTVVRDTVKLIGDIPLNSNLTIDANAGQAPNPNDTINLGAATSAVHLQLDQNGTGQLTSSATGGVVGLTGFHTGVLGSDFDDILDDQSTGHKRISGGAGNDEIVAGGSGSMIFGGDGDDSLTGGDGNDLVDGGDGSGNQLHGGGGSDYLVSRGFSDQIDGGDDADFLQALGFYALADGGGGNDLIDVSQGYGNSVSFGLGGGHDYVILGVGSEVHLDSLQKSDVEFLFSQSATVTVATEPSGSPVDIPGLVSISGDLTIRVKSTGETLTIKNSSGEATFVYDENGQISLGVIYVSQTVYFADGQLTLDDFGGQSGLDVSFSDITAYTTAAAEYAAATVSSPEDTTGTDGDDNLQGGLGDDSISGGLGNDEITTSGGFDSVDGGEGYDTLVTLGASWQFGITTTRDGGVTLNDWLASEGQVALTSIEEIYFSGDDVTTTIVQGTSQGEILQADGSVIMFGKGGDDVLVAGNGFAVLDGGDGDDTLIGGSGNDQLLGGNGSDTINGGEGSDTLTGGLGDDNLLGGAGSDWYVWNLGDGNDVITESSAEEEYNGIGLGVSSGAVSLSRVGDDLIITVDSSGEAITVKDQFSIDVVGGVIGIYFSDGHSWDRDSIAAHAAGVITQGTAGDDVIYGSSGYEIFDAGEGNDVIYASAGDDRYIWNIGDGHDRIIADPDWGGRLDFIQFGAGITTGDLSIHYAADEEHKVDIAVTRIIKITIEAATDYNRNLSVILADGTVLDKSALIASADVTPIPIDGTSGGDQIFGTSRSDLITGGLGDDQIDGGDGADVYIYHSGDGNDTIRDSGSSGQIDTLQLVDLNTSDVTLSRVTNQFGSANDLLVSDFSTAQAVRVVGQFSGYGIEQIKFADGTIYNLADIQQATSTVTGTGGDDLITVDWDGYTIIAGAGNDTFNLGSSSFGGTVVYGAGDGNDTVQSDLYNGLDRDDVLTLDSLNPDDVTFSRQENAVNGESLVITVNGTGETLTALWQFNTYDAEAGFDQITFANGVVWSRADIELQTPQLIA